MKKKAFIGSAILGTMLFSSHAFASTYTVQPGDSLWRIANNNNTTVNSLFAKNNLTSTVIQVGQVLQILNETYTVQNGDTLSAIAKKFSIATTDLLNSNPLITNPDSISIGEIIVLPSLNQNVAITTNTYTVQIGDTLSAIAKKFNIAIQDILNGNPLITDKNYLKIGQIIILPKKTTTQNTTSVSTPTTNSINSNTSTSTNSSQTVSSSSTVDDSQNSVTQSSSSTATNTPQQTVIAQTNSDWSAISDNIIKTGEKYLGTPYQYGALSGTTTAFDCSSFTQKVFAENGITLPRTSQQQAQMGTSIPLSQARKGDLIFFDTALNGVIDHVGILIDQSTMINAQTSKGIAIANLQYYWSPRISKVVRVIK